MALLRWSLPVLSFLICISQALALDLSWLFFLILFSGGRQWFGSKTGGWAWPLVTTPVPGTSLFHLLWIQISDRSSTCITHWLSGKSPGPCGSMEGFLQLIAAPLCCTKGGLRFISAQGSAASRSGADNVGLPWELPRNWKSSGSMTTITIQGV